MSLFLYLQLYLHGHIQSCLQMRIKDYFTLTKVVFPPVGTLTLSPRKLPFMCSHILTQSFLFLFLIIWCAHYCCHLHDKQMLGPEVTLNPRSSIIPHIIHIHLFPSLCLSHTLSLAAAYLPSGGRTNHMHEWRCIWSTYLKPRWWHSDIVVDIWTVNYCSNSFVKYRIGHSERASMPNALLQ